MSWPGVSAEPAWRSRARRVSSDEYTRPLDHVRRRQPIVVCHAKTGAFSRTNTIWPRHAACGSGGRSIVTVGRKGPVNRIRTAAVAVLLASFVGFQPVTAMAQGRDRDRYEDRWDRRQDRRDHRDDRRDDRRDRRDDRYDRRDDRYDARDGYWDPARYYRRDDRRYAERRLGRNDRIYRGSDNRYYCRRDDGTSGLIIGGISGGVLGSILAPGGSKTIGTIIGGAAGAVLGRSIDRGDIVCR